MSERGLTRLIAGERGVGIVELLVSLLLISVVGLGSTMSIILSMHSFKTTELNLAATNLAISKLELLSTVEIEDLDNDYDLTETGLTSPGFELTFRRVTDVTVNGDDTRTAVVTVTTESDALSTEVVYSSTYATWE